MLGESGQRFDNKTEILDIDSRYTSLGKNTCITQLLKVLMTENLFFLHDLLALELVHEVLSSQISFTKGFTHGKSNVIAIIAWS